MTTQAEKPKFRWIALTVSSIAYGLSFGTIQSVGVLYPEWIRAFNAPAKYASFVGSLPTSFGCFVGPICGMAVGKFGCRVCGIIGGFLMFLGLAASYFATSLLYLVFSFGIIPGFGAGLVIVSFSSVINSYFAGDRAIAEGVVGSGICVGIFFTSFMLQQFVEAYSWQGAMLLVGAYCLNLCVCGAFFVKKSKISFHPLNPWKNAERIQQTITLKIISSQKSDEEKMSPVEIPKEHFLLRSRHLWKNPVFLMIITSEFMSWCAMIVPYVHLVERARYQGIEPNIAAWLSSTIGLAGILGRPMTATISTCLKIHPLWAFSINQACLGIATFLSPYWSSIYGLFALAIITGLLSNGYGFIKTSAAVMLGRQHFVDAYSWMLFLEGIGICVGPFLAGVLVDVTHSYDWSFRFAGIMLTTSALLCLLKIPLKKWEARSENDDIPNL